jgi:hypothetical protein
MAESWNEKAKVIIRRSMNRIGATYRNERINWENFSFPFEQYTKDNRQILVAAWSPRAKNFQVPMNFAKGLRRNGYEFYCVVSPTVFDRYLTQIANYRLHVEFGENAPSSFWPCLEDFPVTALDEKGMVSGVNRLKINVDEWCTALFEDRFVYDDGHWKVAA